MAQSDLSSPDGNKSLTDQQAIALLKKGNLTGLTTLVQSYQGKAVHTALIIVQERALAEDVVQDAFLQAYRKIDQYDDRRPFSPWFLRIVINGALKAAIRLKRVIPIIEPEEGSSTVEWLIDPQSGPEDISETMEMRETIWKALEMLNPNQRKAVVMKYFLNKSESEMIEELNQPLTTIKWWLYTSRMRLRLMLHPIDPETPENQEIDYE